MYIYLKYIVDVSLLYACIKEKNKRTDVKIGLLLLFAAARFAAARLAAARFVAARFAAAVCCC